MAKDDVNAIDGDDDDEMNTDKCAATLLGRAGSMPRSRARRIDIYMSTHLGLFYRSCCFGVDVR